jgi:hypothetical protein
VLHSEGAGSMGREKNPAQYLKCFVDRKEMVSSVKTKVRVLAKSQRAKSRIREHGELMWLEQEKDEKFLVRSLNKTWRGEEWLGWFELKTDATFEIVKEE